MSCALCELPCSTLPCSQCNRYVHDECIALWKKNNPNTPLLTCAMLPEAVVRDLLVRATNVKGDVEYMEDCMIGQEDISNGSWEKEGRNGDWTTDHARKRLIRQLMLFVVERSKLKLVEKENVVDLEDNAGLDRYDVTDRKMELDEKEIPVEGANEVNRDVGVGETKEEENEIVSKVTPVKAEVIKEKQTFVCDDCSANVHYCSVCFQISTFDKLSKCSIGRCTRFFHPSCSEKIGFVRNACSSHECDTCKLKRPEIRCVRCVNAFHFKCIPKYVGKLIVEKKLCLCDHIPLPWAKFVTPVNTVVTERIFKPVKFFPETNPKIIFNGFVPDRFDLGSLFLDRARKRMYKDLAPPPFEKIGRNIYLTSSAGEKKHPQEACMCVDYCGSSCLNRLLLFECSAKYCKAKSCSNRNFSNNRDTSIKIAYTGPKRGFGAFTDTGFEKNDFVIEYVGEVIDDQECTRRLAESKKNGLENFYLFQISNNCVVDAQFKGNKARFLNHSCDPNCYSQKWNVGNQIRVGIFAKLDIPAGSELTYNYNFEAFWPVGQERSCNCGGMHCSGIFGRRPRKDAELIDELEDEN